MKLDLGMLAVVALGVFAANAVLEPLFGAQVRDIVTGA